MKKIVQLLFAFVALNLCAQQEQVTRFHADVVVDTTSLIKVSEQIDIISAGNIFKRGIVRYLPMYKTDSTGRQIPMNYKILSVKKEDNTSPYHTRKESGNLVIYVGEKDVFIPDGKHHYTITYAAENTISFYENFDELYWNVNGFGWDFAIPQVSANVYFPDGTEIQQTACYTGGYGSSASQCKSEIEGANATFNAENIMPNENLTIAMGVSKGVLHEPPPPPPPSPPTFFEKFGLLIIGSVLTLLLGIYYFFTWKKYGIDPPKPTVYPQFEVPESLSPASVGMLHKERYWQDLITTSIVNLAIKGYLDIKEDKKEQLFGLFNSTEYTLKKKKEVDMNLPKEEYTLMQKLFFGRSSVTLDGEYKSYIKNTLVDYRKALKEQHHTLLNEGNNYKFLIIPVVAVLLFIVLSLVVSFSFDIDEIFDFVIGGVSFIPFVIFAIIGVRQFKLFNWKWTLGVLSLLLVFLLITHAVTHHFDIQYLNLYSILGFFLFAIISISLYQYYIKKPSVEKLKVQSLIEGFKMYLNTAEEKQLQHFNPPAVTPEVFEKFLPYAIALGADEVWGKRFQNFLQKSSLDSNYQSSWYSGNSFNAMNFGHNLNSSLSNSFSKAATPPSSSGSGSGGGGFSGGGGGGGGGGGW